MSASASTHLLPEKRFQLNARVSGAPQTKAVLAVQGLAPSESGKVRTWIIVILVIMLVLGAVVIIRGTLRAVETKLLYRTKPAEAFADVFKLGNAAAFMRLGIKSYNVPAHSVQSDTAAVQVPVPAASKAHGSGAGTQFGLRYLALVNQTCAGSVVLLHGNSGTAAGMMRVLGSQLMCRNLSVFAPEYPGYAGDASKPSEAALLANVVAFLDHIVATGHAIPGKPLLLLGHSLGAAVAVHVASKRLAAVHSVVLVAPISRVSDVLSARVPYVPFHWLVHDNFDACAWARLTVCPVTIVHGTADVIVPSRISTNLARCFPVPPRVIDLEGATHNDLFDTHSDGIWRAIEDSVADAERFHAVTAH